MNRGVFSGEGSNPARGNDGAVKGGKGGKGDKGGKGAKGGKGGPGKGGKGKCCYRCGLYGHLARIHGWPSRVCEQLYVRWNMRTLLEFHPKNKPVQHIVLRKYTRSSCNPEEDREEVTVIPCSHPPPQ